MKILFIYIIFACFAREASISSDKKRIHAAVGEWPPYISEILRHSGAVAHLIKDIFIDLNLICEIRFFPWARAHEQTANGRYIATAVGMHTKKREIDFFYINSILKEEFVFFHFKDNNFKWEKLSDLQGVKKSGLRKSSFGVEFDHLIKIGKL
jgi:polar amino acid transport system substrate-binding protein